MVGGLFIVNDYSQTNQNYKYQVGRKMKVYNVG